MVSSPPLLPFSLHHSPSLALPQMSKAQTLLRMYTEETRKTGAARPPSLLYSATRLSLLELLLLLLLILLLLLCSAPNSTHYPTCRPLIRPPPPLPCLSPSLPPSLPQPPCQKPLRRPSKGSSSSNTTIIITSNTTMIITSNRGRGSGTCKGCGRHQYHHHRPSGSQIHQSPWMLVLAVVLAAALAPRTALPSLPHAHTRLPTEQHT